MTEASEVYGTRVTGISPGPTVLYNGGKYLLPLRVTVKFPGKDDTPAVAFVAVLNTDSMQPQVQDLRFTGTVRPRDLAVDWTAEAKHALITSGARRVKDGLYEPVHTPGTSPGQAAATKAAMVKRRSQRDQRAMDAASKLIKQWAAGNAAAVQQVADEMGVSATTLRDLFTHARTLDPTLPEPRKPGRPKVTR